MNIKDFLNEYRDILRQKVISSMNPLYNPEKQDLWDREAEKKLSNLMRKPFPAQKHAIIALAKALYREDKKAVIVVGEMGVGKTFIATAVAYLMPGDKFRVIVMCPPHLVEKWIREIKITVPEAKVVNLNDEGISGLEKLRKEETTGRCFYVLSREKAKLSYTVRKSCWNLKHLKYMLCPRCGAEVSEILKKSKRPVCECGEPLYTAENKLRRFAMAEYIKKYLSFDLFIADEVHELKGGATAQGRAFACIAAASRKTIALTGTLMGGYATNIFYILWRLVPDVMKKKALSYKAPKDFAYRYGVVEEVRVEKLHDEFTTASIGKSRGSRLIVREKPGISPALLTDFLLERCVFLRLADISSSLPPYEEEVVSVQMQEDQKEAYKKLEEDLYNETRSALARGDHSLLGALVNSLLAYPDGARKGEVVIHPHTEEVIAEAPAIEACLLPKEEKLVEILKREKAEGRKCIVYVEHTGTRDIAEELRERISSEGINAFVLRSTTVKPEKREEYVKKHSALYDVMILNPRLVQTGLDLVEFPTVIFFQTGYSIFTLRQASRRSWRIGQRLPVRVYYLCYEETMQERALSLMAEKLETSLAVEGELSDKGLVAIAESSNSMLYELARTLVGERDVRNLGEAWQKYRKTELQVDSFLDDDSSESTTVTYTRGDRTVTFRYRRVVRGRIYPKNGYAIAYVGRERFPFLFKDGVVYYKNRRCGHYNRKGIGKIAGKDIQIVKHRDCYLLVELKKVA